MLHALAGRDRAGQPLPLAALDLDGDGRVSLLEAHTRARLHAATGDVPTTTSERWLRAHAPARGPSRRVRLPEEQAVIEGLTRTLDVTGPDEAAARLDALEAEIESRLQALERARQDEDRAFRAAAAELLAYDPLLDDPWHPGWHDTFTRARPRIALWLREAATHRAYLRARTRVDHLAAQAADLRVRAAQLERLVRAQTTVAAAARLRARGGHAWHTYLALLTCERATPAAATPGDGAAAAAP